MIDKIDKANYIVIQVDKKNIPSASALYTHILRLHKKVSLVCVDEDIDNHLSFLPWFDKIKNTKPSSADLVIDLDMDSVELFEWFATNKISLNKKMATALYAGLLIDTDGFKNSSVNGMKFAMANELISCDAEYKLCTKFILNSSDLSTLRLKAILFKGMLLKENATLVFMNISDDDLKKCGAKIQDCEPIMKEALNLPYAKEVVLVNSDKENEILRRIKKEY